MLVEEDIFKIEVILVSHFFNRRVRPVSQSNQNNSSLKRNVTKINLKRVPQIVIHTVQCRIEFTMKVDDIKNASMRVYAVPALVIVV